MSSVTGARLSRVARAGRLLFQRIAPFSTPSLMAVGVTGLIFLDFSKRFSRYRLRRLIGWEERRERPAAGMIEAISY